MKRDLLEQALDQVDEAYVASAANAKRRSHRYFWLSTAAAIFVLSVSGFLLWSVVFNSPSDMNLHTPTNAPVDSTNAVPLAPHQIAAPIYPQLCRYPLDDTVGNSYADWSADRRDLRNQPKGYADSLNDYFSSFVSKLSAADNGSNLACSPVNVYMALAMLAETTSGESREQLLDLLGADSIESLRTQAGQVWRGHYSDDGLSTCILGSSLWLEEGYPTNAETVQLLADSYYASVFQGDLGSNDMNQALQNWLNQETGGLLADQVQNVELSQESVLTLATTILYKVQWMTRFWEENNTEGTFHGTAGDTAVSFMNQELTYGPYFWSEQFGATYLYLEDSSRLWLFLPDAGVTPEAITEDAMRFLATNPDNSENQKYIRVNLSLPKFDISSDLDLVSVLQELGITDVFQHGVADFSPIISIDDGGCVDTVKHAARVAVNEEGVTAAAFTVIDRCGAAMPPEDEVDFILDRPFFFVITSYDGLPLFTGIVNQL